MAKTKTKAKKSPQITELDSVFIMKAVLYLILGSQWLFINQPSGGRLPLPIGLCIGIAFAVHDHFQIDRKIEYAVLLVAMLVGFMANIGISIAV